MPTMPPLFPTNQVSTKQVSGIIICLKIGIKQVLASDFKGKWCASQQNETSSTPLGSHSPGYWGKTSIAPKSSLPAVPNMTLQTSIDSYHESRSQEDHPQLSNIPSLAN